MDVLWAKLTGQKNVYEHPPGSTRRSLYTTEGGGYNCALEDYDCDGIVNYIDPDWTDGPGENGKGDPLCKYFNQLN